jgi:hypothetical protein
MESYLLNNTLILFTGKTIETKKHSSTIYKIPTEISKETPLKKPHQIIYTTLKSYRRIAFKKYLSLSENFNASLTNCRNKYKLKVAIRTKVLLIVGDAEGIFSFRIAVA